MRLCRSLVARLGSNGRTDRIFCKSAMVVLVYGTSMAVG